MFEMERFLLLTGPNMGGKSTILRQTCLLAILAQVGCYVPCKSYKAIVFDQIFCRIGAADRIIEGIYQYLYRKINILCWTLRNSPNSETSNSFFTRHYWLTWKRYFHIWWNVYCYGYNQVYSQSNWMLYIVHHSLHSNYSLIHRTLRCNLYENVIFNRNYKKLIRNKTRKTQIPLSVGKGSCWKELC